MQGTSEWWIFHKGNRMFVGDLPDLQGQGINALGDAHRRIHSPLIFERHGKVSRIGDDDGGFWDYGGHADLPYLLHLPFDGRITFRLFEFFFQLADRHFLPLVPLPIFRGFWPRTWQISLWRTDSGHIEGVGMSQSPFKNGNSRTFEVWQRPVSNAFFPNSRLLILARVSSS